MKKNHFLLLCGFFLLFATTAQAQSTFEIFVIGALKDKYVAIKGEEIQSKERYAYMFSNSSRYRVLVKSTNPKTKILIKILDKDEKEVATSLYKKKYHSEINFKCGKTGMYYVIFKEINE